MCTFCIINFCLVKWWPERRILIDADVFCCCGNICPEIFNFIQIGPCHTV